MSESMVHVSGTTWTPSHWAVRLTGHEYVFQVAAAVHQHFSVQRRKDSSLRKIIYLTHEGNLLPQLCHHPHQMALLRLQKGPPSPLLTSETTRETKAHPALPPDTGVSQEGSQQAESSPAPTYSPKLLSHRGQNIISKSDPTAACQPAAGAWRRSTFIFCRMWALTEPARPDSQPSVSSSEVVFERSQQCYVKMQR